MKMVRGEERRDKPRASARLPGQPQTAAGASARGERDSATHARDRLTVDLRGIGSAVKAEAAARHLTLAAFARMAMVASLKQTVRRRQSTHPSGDDDGQTVKLTLRLPIRQAHWLVEHARAAGLSYGTFVASVIDGAPCPGSLAEAVRALTESTDQMAVLSRDLNAGMRLLASREDRGDPEVPSAGRRAVRRGAPAPAADVRLGRRSTALRSLQADELVHLRPSGATMSAALKR